MTGAQVTSLEMDPSAVELNWRACVGREDERVMPLLMDLSNPTPAQGWAHEEVMSLERRGPADLVMALALIHHIAIGNNVPLGSIVAWLARLGDNAVVEWIPKEDAMVQRLLETREDVFDDYGQEAFERAINEAFDIVSCERIDDSLRCLYVLVRREARSTR